MVAVIFGFCLIIAFVWAALIDGDFMVWRLTKFNFNALEIQP
jgi:hypothetical protein